MNFYVYKITNIINNKIYVGQTTESLKQRFKRHTGYQLNMDYASNEEFIFDSIDEAVRQLDLKTHSNVYKILNNKTDKAYKNTWLFEEYS